MIETTMKLVGKFDEEVGPGEIGEALVRLNNKCFESFGNGGVLKTLMLEPSSNGGKTLVAIVEVEG